MAKRPSKQRFKTGSVTVTVDYGYDVHSIRFSKRTFDRVKARKKVSVRGQGFWIEGRRVQDVWDFNEDDRAAVRVHYRTRDDAGDIFVGNLASARIETD